MPANMRAGCEQICFKNDFAETQWKRKNGRRFCQDCVKSLSHDGQRRGCHGDCNQWKPEEINEQQKRIQGSKTNQEEDQA